MTLLGQDINFQGPAEPELWVVYTQLKQQMKGWCGHSVWPRESLSSPKGRGWMMKYSGWLSLVLAPGTQYSPG